MQYFLQGKVNKVNNQELQQNLKDNIETAIECENTEHVKYYIYYSIAGRHYCLTKRMPVQGEWYTSDGKLHGKIVFKKEEI